MSILNHLGKRILILDGATGTLLQQRGLLPGQRPEDWNVERPEDIRAVHQAYFEAGSDLVLTNTFGANPVKLGGSPYSLDRVVSAAVENAKEASVRANVSERPLFVALDVGPTGKLLRPLGDLDFLDAVSAFSALCKAGAKAGADLIFIETMSDLYELKAAALAAKETGLPVFATVAPDASGKLLTGGDAACVTALLTGLGVDALGFNCGMGPVQLRPYVSELLALSGIPVIAKPNAGLPTVVNGKTEYDIDVPAFAAELSAFAKEGVWLLGGCCGTTPAHILALSEAVRGISPKPIEKKHQTIVCSYGRAVSIPNPKTDGVPALIGERINPTGKPRLKAALRDGDFGLLLSEAAAQQEQGAEVLDVNVGLPGIDEPETLKQAVERIQSVTDLPLQLDSANAKALEEAMRIYNGKPLVNSVNGKESSMHAVFPLVQKYGGVVIALTLDESGIPDTAEGRLEIARKIVHTAESYGIDRKDILVDPLTLTVSTDANAAKTALRTIELVRKELGVGT
ncbi:MAG: homocysteine S-methyltransferase family protein, partial [Christensenellales bacterium]